MFSCSNSSDCDDFFDDGVVRQCYGSVDFSAEENFCDCSNWYGWTGEMCDEPSFQLHFWRSSLILTALWSLALCSFILYFISSVLLKNNVTHNLKLQCYISSCFFLSTILSLGAALLSMPAAFNSSLFRVIPVESLSGKMNELIISNLGIVAYMVQIVGLAAAQFGNMMIILSWIKVLNETAAYFPEYECNTCNKLRKFLRIFFPGATLLLIVLTAISNLALIGVFVVILLIVTLGIYSFFTYSFLSRINRMSFYDTVKLVRRSFIVIFVCVSLTLLCIVGVTIGAQFYLEKLGVGDFNYNLFLHDLAWWVTLANISFAVSYLRGRIKSILKNSSARKSSNFMSAASSPFSEANL